MKVAGFGEIMLRLSTNRGNRISQANNFNANYGGGEANVLISLSNFGIDTSFITRLSSNYIGDSIISYLNSKSIDTKNITRVNKRTGIYFLEIGSGNRVSKVIYDRENSAFSTLKYGDINIDEALEGIDIFHFSGITLALSPDIRKIVKDILVKCKEKNILVSYDSNYRAKLWSLEEARKATLDILPYVNILSFGVLDAENILNMKCDIENKHDKLKYYYTELEEIYPNIIHMFSSFRDIESSSINYLQCNYFNNGTLYKSNILKIDDIVDRVGGGDALTAGALYGIIKSKDGNYISNFANSASVLKHSIFGDANCVDVDEIESIMRNEGTKIQR
ncbi:sugar kinase [Clostridium sp. C8]|uniref:sugar kinase n=1 Tax=Clostridium sp. C8 TaxID=1667357 RepID=UPI00062E6A52|nr:sugar kinase [Clostridium sp. C8]KLE15738.1 2-dehydro-3-deoxygluconokinase [Clostridium sp. C8]